MERAQALPVRSGLAKVHEPAHEIDDVDGGADVVEQRLGVLHQPTFSAATVAPVPPSDGSPSRKDSTRGWPDRRSRTVLRRAPLPLPWTNRTLARPARKASSRYFSTRSRASSVVCPSSMISPRPAPAGDLGAGRRAERGTRTVTEPERTVAELPAISTSSP